MSFSEQIKYVINHVNIVDVISNDLKLTKKGKLFEANCCFHDEKSPSFKVNEAKQKYNCYGCGENGDALDFVVAYHGLNKSEALDKICRDFGISIPEELKQREEKKKPEHRTTLIHRIGEYALKCTKTMQGQGLIGQLIKNKNLSGFEIGVINQPERILEAIRSNEKLLLAAKEMGLVADDKFNLAQGPVFINRSAANEIKTIYDFNGRVIYSEAIPPLISKFTKNENDCISVYTKWDEFLRAETEAVCFIGKPLNNIQSYDISKLTSKVKKINFKMPDEEVPSAATSLANIYKDGNLIFINGNPLLDLVFTRKKDEINKELFSLPGHFKIVDFLALKLKDPVVNQSATIANMLILDKITSSFGVKSEAVTAAIISEKERGDAEIKDKMKSSLSSLSL